MTAIQTLNGLKIVGIEELEDYIQIEFANSTHLSIFNKCSYSGNLLSDLQGSTVKSISESDKLVLIEFEEGQSLEIGLSDDDYVGPEAMTLRKEGKPPIVWN